jgi:hypothetical protein
MECPIHARSKPKFTKAYLFGLIPALLWRHFTVERGESVMQGLVALR